MEGRRVKKGKRGMQQVTLAAGKPGKGREA